MKVWEVKLIVDAIVDGPLNDFILFLIPVSMSIPCIKQKNQFTVFKYPDDILNILLTLKLIVINILTPTVSRKLKREKKIFFHRNKSVSHPLLMIKTLTYIHLKSSWLCISHHFILYEKEGQSSRAYRREQRYMFIYKTLMQWLPCSLSSLIQFKHQLQCQLTGDFSMSCTSYSHWTGENKTKHHP